MKSSIPRFLVLRWLALTVAGWLCYVLVGTLLIIIRLDTPLYDWQWYVPFSLLLVVLPVWLVWRWPAPRFMRVLYGVLLLWAVVGYHPPGATEHLSLADAPPIPISFWAYTDFRHVPNAVLEDLQATEATLYLSVRGSSLAGEQREKLTTGVQRLGDYDIPVILHPDASDFLSVPVYEEWSTLVISAATLIVQEDLTNVRGIIGDAEPPRHSSLIPGGTTAAQVEAATSGLQHLIATIHRNYPDLTIGVTASWPLYLDGVDGDSDLAWILQSPVDPPGGWDFVNVMAYSSYFPPAMQAYTVAVTERGLAARYPDTPQSYLIGLVGGGMPGEPLHDFDELVRDAHISRALGAPEIVVFQLNGALEVFGDDFVERFNSAVNEPQADTTITIPFSRLASLGNYLTALIDTVLDIRGPRIWLVAGWAAVCLGIVWLYARARHAAA